MVETEATKSGPATPGTLNPRTMVRIFDGHASPAEGREFEEYLREVAMTLSRYDAFGNAVDRDTQNEFEGKRALAIALLGARAEVARMEQPAQEVEE